MLKPIPQEEPDIENRECKCKKHTRKGKKDKSPKHKRRSSLLENQNNKLLRLIGRKLFMYGKKAKMKTSREIHIMILEMQRSILCLQKQQRAVFRKQQNKKKGK